MFLFQLRRNGNCNVKTEQLSTHKRNIELLKAEGIHPQKGTDGQWFLHQEVTDFFMHQIDFPLFHQEPINLKISCLQFLRIRKLE
ncbi:MAG: hypothetical protein M9887_11210 [Chitinophagales bacterium]|nr:hypothetical protein [Chitinophagales bacterium]